MCIRTRMGTKAADVAWAARERFEQIRQEVECFIAPEVCVEVFSPGNTAQEMREKQGLYFEAGAEEVCYCDEDGRLSFFDAEGPLATSWLFPEFPQNIEL
jgi:Uma2 family endonuclease